jgi:hypothetical protein
MNLKDFNTDYFATVGQAIFTVLIVGVIFGAGLPALFATGLTSLYGGQAETNGTVVATKNPARVAAGWLAFAVVVALIAFGIAVIILGKPFLIDLGLVSAPAQTPAHH